jgi:long-chain acyl-CoA synthetase
VNIAHSLQQVGRAEPNRPAVALGTTVVVSYGQLADRAARLAGNLRTKLNLRPGDRAALVMRNCPEYLEVLYGCWHAGLVAVPVNAKLHPNEFAYIIESSGTRVCFASRDLADAVATATKNQLEHVISIGGEDYSRLFECDASAPAERMADDIAWLFYTSGTTGRPKGAMLTCRNLMAMSLCYFVDVDQEPPWNCILHAAPMSHGSGLYALPHVMKASCHVIPESGGFSPEEVFELIRRWKGLCFFAAPTMVKRLVNHPVESDTRNLKEITYGGGPMYVEDARAALDRFGPKLIQIYGQGESPMTITALSRSAHANREHPRWLARLASVGLCHSIVEVRVCDADDNPLPPGEPGEVLVRGDTVMAGYWENPEATASTLRGGWLHTGDIGAFDEDGFLTLKDRSKDLIISGGSNIYPREVEEVLQGDPTVAEVSVIARPDPEWGEIPVAYVVPRPGALIDPAALDRRCLEHIARYKRPRDYCLVKELPKNNYGKVVKTELRRLDTEQLHRMGSSG